MVASNSGSKKRSSKGGGFSLITTVSLCLAGAAWYNQNQYAYTDLTPKQQQQASPAAHSAVEEKKAEETRESAPAVPAVVTASTIASHKASLLYLGNEATNTGWKIGQICLKNKPSLLVYGVGAGEDISWDLGLIEKFHAHVHLFDPTEKSNKYTAPLVEKHAEHLFSTKEGMSDQKQILEFALPANPDHVSMRTVDLADKDMTKTVQIPVNTLQNWMNTRKHDYLDILKIDIEGSEYPVLEALCETDFMPFTQLLIEFHDRMLEQKDRHRHDDVLKLLKQKGFVLLWSVNNGQEVGFLKLADVAYCEDGTSARIPTYVDTKMTA